MDRSLIEERLLQAFFCVLDMIDIKRGGFAEKKLLGLSVEE